MNPADLVFEDKAHFLSRTDNDQLEAELLDEQPETDVAPNLSNLVEVKPRKAPRMRGSSHKGLSFIADKILRKGRPSNLAKETLEAFRSSQQMKPTWRTMPLDAAHSKGLALESRPLVVTKWKVG